MAGALLRHRRRSILSTPRRLRRCRRAVSGMRSATSEEVDESLLNLYERTTTGDDVEVEIDIAEGRERVLGDEDEDGIVRGGSEESDDVIVEGDTDFLMGYTVHRRVRGEDIIVESDTLGTVCEIVDLPHGHFLIRIAPSLALIPFEEVRRHLSSALCYPAAQAREGFATCQHICTHLCACIHSFLYLYACFLPLLYTKGPRAVCR